MNRNKLVNTINKTGNEEKKAWVKPTITDINVSAVKQKEEELYLQMLADPEVFQRLTESGGTGGSR